MARLSVEQKELILNRWRCGESQNSLAKRFSCSPATVNAICKGVEQDNAVLVNTQLQINQSLMQKPNEEVNAIREIVNEQTRMLEFFNKSAIRNQRLANKILDESEELNMAVIESHARTTARNRETVLGKVTPENQNNVAVQINGMPSAMPTVIEIVAPE
jgi:hypothetical protein